MILEIFYKISFFFSFIQGRSASRTIVSGALGERNNCRTAQTVHAASEIH